MGVIVGQCIPDGSYTMLTRGEDCNDASACRFQLWSRWHFLTLMTVEHDCRDNNTDSEQNKAEQFLRIVQTRREREISVDVEDGVIFVGR